jgi:dihydroneopterin aldolase
VNAGDRIELPAVTLETVIGVNPWERRVRQRLTVDVAFGVDAARGAASDDLADAVDYGAVAERLRAVAAVASDRLIETLAERLAADLLATFDLPWVHLALHKPGAVPNAGPVTLVIERRR